MSKLKNVTIYIPELFVDTLEELEKLGIISSRSQGVRIAVKKLVEKDKAFQKDLLDFKKKIV